LDYVRLLRLPNVCTALADVAMGFLFVRGTLEPWPVFLLLAVTSACLYSAGMVLNDVWDIEDDRRLRPERVLPTGRIEWTVARRLGWALLVSGLLCGWCAGAVGMVSDAVFWRSGLVATLLAASVVAYDGWLKRTVLGPLAMGACRLLNVLLGMSLAGSMEGIPTWGGWGRAHWLAAGGMGVYIAGVTWLARTEATVSRRGALAGATGVIVTGLVLLACIQVVLPAGLGQDTMQPRAWYSLMGLLSFVIVRRCLVAVLDPRPRCVQLAVKNCIMSIIILDAAIVMLVCGLGWSLVVLSLVVPALIGGWWISAT
jgi:4-hydroxybenzoate polyprenyltransferase